MKYWSTMNAAQRQACKRLWLHHTGFGPYVQNDRATSETYLAFRRRFHLHFGDFFGGVVPCGIFIGIEEDGHAHS